jgi:hypothetical protein
MHEGQRSYREWCDSLMADPSFRALYEEEAAKKELWLQLVEARQRSDHYPHPTPGAVSRTRRDILS